jgi:predicted O-methyltransferase YrrM
MPQLMQKLVNGNRETHRLKDEKGNLIPVSRLLRNGPRAAATFVGRKFFSVRPPVPWISYDARELLVKLLPREASVLEFGSGLSTLWYSRQFGKVMSVEDHEGWYHEVCRLLDGHKRANARLYYHQGAAYCNFAEAAGEKFDLAMIDGSNRDGCMRFALGRMKADAVVYLDNSDKHPQGGDTRGAEAQLLEAAQARGGRVVYFTDFAPTDLFVNQGLLAAFGRYVDSV